MANSKSNDSDGAFPAPNLSQEQTRDVRDLLKKPLTGQQVLVPFTSKAFFPGTLKPSVSAGGDEQVVLRDKSGIDKVMTRREALDCLQVEIDSFKPPPKAKAAPKLKSAIRNPAPKPSSAPPPLDAPLPYFEIREEYNDSGQPIAAQAINVTKQLEYLQKQAAGESVTHVPPEAKQDDVPESQSALEQVHVDSLAPLTDQEYTKKADRLEELMRLEEQDGQPMNAPSKIKTMRGKGWSKGFLNSSTKKKKAPKVKTAPQATGSERKVAFHAENQVKEIPRVGERSINEVRKQAATPTMDPAMFSNLMQELQPGSERRVDFHAEDHVQDIPGAGGRSEANAVRQPAPSKPIEESVLSGVVRERSVASKAAKQTQSQSQNQEPEPKKKLSRFAQQRLG